ncbi:MAG: SUMF1/EgtB/PvdO family nonheme iron enzyme [Bacteroidia bacterium]|nr:SUMF1/EgtB/PvdO family nonheme iron enzyme [Bacteroidia bacterium]
MTEEKYNINDDELNELLRKTFLNDNAGNFNDDISKVVFSQEYNVKIDPEKEKNLLKRFSGKGTMGTGMIYSVIFISVIVIIGFIAHLVYHSAFDFQTSKNTNLINEEITKIASNSDFNIEKLEGLGYYSQQSTDKKKKNIEISREVNDQIKSFIALHDTNQLSLKKQIADTNRQELFVLNPKLIQRYWKIKQMMMDKLLNKDKKLYRYIDDGSVNYKGEEIGITAFTIHNCVITNLEYRTFLIDLLIQGRFSDYSKAKVKPEIWNNYKFSKLAVDYFKAEEYNDFPVVNISQEGVELFCSWFEQETKKYAKTIKKSIVDFKLRLPYDAEWMLLAEYGYTSLPDNGGYLTIFDINEGYIDKSLDRRIKSLQKKYKIESTVDEFYATNRYGMSESEVINILNKGFEVRSVEPFDTIYPSRMKDYTAIGHVSEMILERQSGKKIVFGVGWRSKDEFNDMLKDYTKFSGSPFVGMRFVVVYNNAPEYKNPFW